MNSPTGQGRPALDTAWLRRAVLAGGGLWARLDVVDQTSSTNADVAAAARAGAPEGSVLVAEYQRAGRGRSGRTWTSPARAGLTFSVVLRPGPGVPVSTWGWLSLLGGVALAGAVRQVTGLAAVLKWPNDLLVGDRKCAGVLAEVADDAVVLGVGVNVTTTSGELPARQPGAPAATSLALAGAGEPAREPLLVELLYEMESWYARWRAAAGAADRCGLRAAYLAVSHTVGTRVRVVLPAGGELVGEATTIDPEGRLVLRLDDGTIHRVAAGDVRHLRVQ